jgi:hypothetical protein
MGVKSSQRRRSFLVLILVSLFITVFGQLPYRKDFVWTFQPNEWKFLVLNIVAIAQDEMIVTDYTHNASDGTFHLFAQFDQNPTLTENFPFSQFESSETRAIGM